MKPPSAGSAIKVSAGSIVTEKHLEEVFRRAYEAKSSDAAPDRIDDVTETALQEEDDGV